MLCRHNAGDDGSLFSRAIDEYALGEELFNSSGRGGFQGRCVEDVEGLSSFLLLDKLPSELDVGSYLLFEAGRLFPGVPRLFKFLLSELENYATYLGVEAHLSSIGLLVGRRCLMREAVVLHYLLKA